jgi:hypothetical protein
MLKCKILKECSCEIAIHVGIIVNDIFIDMTSMNGL